MICTRLSKRILSEKRASGQGHGRSKVAVSVDVWAKGVHAEETATARSLRNEHASCVRGQVGRSCGWTRVTRSVVGDKVT